MICFLNKKNVLIDSDPQMLARAKQILDQNRIEYEVKTTTSDNVLSRNFNAKAAQYRFTSYDQMARQSYVYYLYVRRKDYEKTKKLIAGI